MINLHGVFPYTPSYKEEHSLLLVFYQRWKGDASPLVRWFECLLLLKALRPLTLCDGFINNCIAAIGSNAKVVHRGLNNDIISNMFLSLALAGIQAQHTSFSCCVLCDDRAAAPLSEMPAAVQLSPCLSLAGSLQAAALAQLQGRAWVLKIRTCFFFLLL